VRAFLEGVVAGYGIAIPVGPIAVLIVGIGTRYGFPRAFFAGLGAALADLTYATVAAVAGAAAATVLAPYDRPLRVAGGVILVIIALVMGASSLRPASPGGAGPSTHPRATAAFFSITLMNPVTFTYFAALILGSSGSAATTATGRALFVAGAFLASLSWQTAVGAVGAILGHRMSQRTRVATGVVGAGVIVALAIRMLVSA
jgi:arginine exporter protein ArgO